jgi:hypothetical protein
MRALVHLASLPVLDGAGAATVVQNLGGLTQALVDYDLHAGQDTGEKQSNEVEDGGDIHVYFFPFSMATFLAGFEILVHRVFVAMYNTLWEQTEAITQPWSDLGYVRNELLELCQKTILLALRETT